VETLVQDDVHCENVAFFTARYLAVPWERCPETTSDDPIGNDASTGTPLLGRPHLYDKGVNQV
jgi:hypothetical protein